MNKDIEWHFNNKQPSSKQIDDWNNLSESNPNSVASSFFIFSQLSQLIMDNSEFIYAFAYHQNEMICAVPLFKKTKKIVYVTIQVLQIVNHSHMDIYVMSGQDNFTNEELLFSLEQALQTQLSGWDYFQGHNWLFDNPIISKFTNHLYANGAGYYKLNDVISIDEIVSRKLLKNIRRHQRKMIANEAVLDIKTFSDLSNVDTAYKLFLDLENSGWKKKINTSIKSTANLERFYNSMWSEFALMNKTYEFLLYLNHEPIAGALAFKHKNNIYLHKIAYSVWHWR